MEEVGQPSDTASLISGYSSTSVLDGPSHLAREYEPLTEVFAKQNEPLPQKNPGIKESNSEAVIRALKSLQDKIRHLELDRAVAADKFKQLTEETRREVTHQRRDGGEEDSSSTDNDSDLGTPPLVPRPLQSEMDGDFTHRLKSLDTRFALQSRELQVMKDRLKQSETARESVMTRNQELELKHKKLLKKMKSPSPLKDTSPFNKEAELRLKKLENEQARLEAEHISASSKLDDLEGEMLQERWERRQAQRYSPEVLVRTENRLPCERRKKTAVRKRKGPPPVLCHHKPVPGIHYHLNMKDVPFVVGKSTGPSHSVTANYQKVLSLMKNHSPILCGAQAANIGVSGGIRKKTTPANKGGAKKRPATINGPSSDELERLLLALEAEFGRLTFEHQELAQLLQKQQSADNVHSSSSAEICNDLETELSQVVNKLEDKMEQIQIVKKLLKERRLQERQLTTPKSGQPRTQTSVSVPQNGEVEIITTVKSKKDRVSYYGGSSGDEGYERTGPLQPESLQVLRRMKRLQSTLQRDDLSWN